MFIPTNVFAAKIAATATVVPKSASDSIALPFHDTAEPKVQTANGIKNTTADWYKPSSM